MSHSMRKKLSSEVCDQVHVRFIPVCSASQAALGLGFPFMAKFVFILSKQRTKKRATAQSDQRLSYMALDRLFHDMVILCLLKVRVII